MWCDQAISVWSRWHSVFIFLTNCMHHFHSYILQKTPLKLVNWFQRYEQLKDAKNIRKQKTFSTLFGSILKSVFLASDWFCLITSHIVGGMCRLRQEIVNFICVKLCTHCTKLCPILFVGSHMWVMYVSRKNTIVCLDNVTICEKSSMRLCWWPTWER